MEKFEVGDLVEVATSCSGCIPGRVYKLKEHAGALFARINEDQAGCCCQSKFILIKKGNKLKSIKQRIEALNNGWDKEADDILMKIQKEGNICSTIVVYQDKDSGCGHIYIGKGYDNFKGERFYFPSQCEKMKAFKDALMWLAKEAGMLDEKIPVTINGKDVELSIESAKALKEALRDV